MSGRDVGRRTGGGQAINALTFLQKQFANLNTVFHGIVDDLTEDEWLARPAPGQNMLGYSVWHMPRTQDTFVQTWIRGRDEVVHRERWTDWQPLRRFGAGIGISLDEADEIARSVRRADVLEYADAVQQEVSIWLGTGTDSELDLIPDMRRRLSAFPEYQTPGFVEEAASLYDQPVWALLMRPCIGHIHRHLGELEVVKTIIRAQRTSSS
jgi:hypothetical protein